jgi:hypothetical protein
MADLSRLAVHTRTSCIRPAPDEKIVCPFSPISGGKRHTIIRSFLEAPEKRGEWACGDSCDFRLRPQGQALHDPEDFYIIFRSKVFAIMESVAFRAANARISQRESLAGTQAGSHAAASMMRNVVA